MLHPCLAADQQLNTSSHQLQTLLFGGASNNGIELSAAGLSVFNQPTVAAVTTATTTTPFSTHSKAFDNDVTTQMTADGNNGSSSSSGGVFGVSAATVNANALPFFSASSDTANSTAASFSPFTSDHPTLNPFTNATATVNNFDVRTPLSAFDVSNTQTTSVTGAWAVPPNIAAKPLFEPNTSEPPPSSSLTSVPLQPAFTSRNNRSFKTKAVSVTSQKSSRLVTHSFGSDSSVMTSPIVFSETPAATHPTPIDWPALHVLAADTQTTDDVLLTSLDAVKKEIDYVHSARVEKKKKKKKSDATTTCMSQETSEEKEVKGDEEDVTPLQAHRLDEDKLLSQVTLFLTTIMEHQHHFEEENYCSESI